MDDWLGRDDDDGLKNPGTTDTPTTAAATPQTPPTPPTPPPDPADATATAEYQRQLQEYSRLMEMYSNILKDLEDTQRSIIRNVRS